MRPRGRRQKMVGLLSLGQGRKLTYMPYPLSEATVLGRHGLALVGAVLRKGRVDLVQEFTHRFV
ncbi:hypothetical protein NW813_06380 [Synechococcus sp. R55.6]|uniref:hypothetical protein n=1 Tax=unclassified Synechococcus TaxID=2626047 RepID=UPI0039C39680